MDSRNPKRVLPVANDSNKKLRRDDGRSEDTEELVSPNIPQLPPMGSGLDENNDINFEAFDDPVMTVAQKSEVSEIRAFLKKCYDEAPTATLNPNIHRLIPVGWHLARYLPDNKSLAYILHMEEGWTVAGMKEIIGKSPVPFVITPLQMRQSRWLWTSIRWSNRVNSLIFKVDLPPKWLTDKMNAKQFSQKCAILYAQKLAATVAFNQEKFIGKADYWFRPLCEELGFSISENFMKFGLRIILFVVCADSTIFETSTKDIKGTWGESQNRFKIPKAFKKAVKEAETKNSINYPDTFQLFKNLFPDVLN
jgi:hypothetical protein